MELSEREAKTKMCPIKTSGLFASSRNFSDVSKYETCEGSNCMMWFVLNQDHGLGTCGLIRPR